MQVFANDIINEYWLEPTNLTRFAVKYACRQQPEIAALRSRRAAVAYFLNLAGETRRKSGNTSASRTMLNLVNLIRTGHVWTEFHAPC